MTTHKRLAYILQNEHVKGKAKIDWPRYDVFICNPTLAHIEEARMKANEGAIFLAAFDFVFLIERNREIEGGWLTDVIDDSDVYPKLVKGFSHFRPKLSTYGKYAEFVSAHCARWGFDGVYWDDAGLPIPDHRWPEGYADAILYEENRWLAVRQFLFRYFDQLSDGFQMANCYPTDKQPSEIDGCLIEEGTMRRMGWGVSIGYLLNPWRRFNTAFEWEKSHVNVDQLPDVITLGERLPQ